MIGTASGDNINFLKELGADEGVDYKRQNFEDLLHDIDLVFDASPLRDDSQRIKCVHVLKTGGIIVSVNVDFLSATLF